MGCLRKGPRDPVMRCLVYDQSDVVSGWHLRENIIIVGARHLWLSQFILERMSELGVYRARCLVFTLLL